MEGEEAGKWEMLAGQGINAVAEAGLRFYCNILFYGNSAARRLYRCIVDGLTDCHNSTINRPLSPFAIHPLTDPPSHHWTTLSLVRNLLKSILNWAVVGRWVGYIIQCVEITLGALFPHHRLKLATMCARVEHFNTQTSSSALKQYEE